MVRAFSLVVGGVGKGGRRWWWVRLRGRCWSSGDVFLLLLVVFVVAVYLSMWLMVVIAFEDWWSSADA